VVITHFLSSSYGCRIVVHDEPVSITRIPQDMTIPFGAEPIAASR
jgi:hypothetical protein